MMKTIKSNKQRRAEIMVRRTSKRQLAVQLSRAKMCVRSLPTNRVPVAREKLTPNNSVGFDWHDFVERGYYLPVPFTCKDCGASEVWSEASQKFWYEEVGGDVFTTAVRCRPCRAKERNRRNLHRARSIAGWITKQKRMTESTTT
jgi:hypothetical protein